MFYKKKQLTLTNTTSTFPFAIIMVAAILKSVSIKKKEVCSPGLNLDHFYLISRSPLPLHYHTNSPKLDKSFSM